MAQNALILLATGRDRPGIVGRVSGLIYDAGCNLEDSRMAILGGEFALIVLTTGSSEGLARVRQGMPALAKDLGLTVQLKETVAGRETRRGAAPSIPFKIKAVAMDDHPGIVHKLTHILAAREVNVARLDTSLSNAPGTGTPVFSIDLEAEVPTDVSVAALRSELLRFAEEENIDLEMRAAR
ncbi:MAG: glycine cleavage system protein R [Planctomycetes bacterium]|nr:glycine cleavage system protein R [Planctomycetota bacterium]